MKVTKEFKVGLLAVVSITILYLGFNFLKGINFFKSTAYYYAVYERIDGLNISNDVILNGLAVGRVADITILPNSGNKILVELDIDSDVDVYQSTVAKLISQDLLGSKAIELVISEQSAQSVLQDGDTLLTDVDQGLTDAIAETAKPLTEDLGVTIKELNKLLKEINTNTGKISNTMTNFEESSRILKETMQDNQQNIDELLTNYTEVARQLAFVLQDLPPVVSKMNQFADSLNDLEMQQTMQSLQSTLSSLDATVTKINEGTGSMGKLINDDSLYVNLNKTMDDLDKLLIDIKENPGRYINFSVF